MSMFEPAPPDEELLSLLGPLFQTGLEQDPYRTLASGAQGAYQNPFTPNYHVQQNMQNMGGAAGIDNIFQLLGIGEQPELPPPPMEPINDIETAFGSNQVLGAIFDEMKINGADPMAAVNRVRNAGVDPELLMAALGAVENDDGTTAPNWDFATEVAGDFAKTQAQLQRQFTQDLTKWEQEVSKIPQYGFTQGQSRDDQVREMADIMGQRRGEAISGNATNAVLGAVQNAGRRVTGGAPGGGGMGGVAQGIAGGMAGGVGNGAAPAPAAPRPQGTRNMEMNPDATAAYANQVLNRYRGDGSQRPLQPTPDTAAGLNAVALVNELLRQGR